MNIKRFNNMLVFAVTANLMFWPVAQANPVGATVVNGQVSFSQPNANTLSITNSPNAIINWQGFDIGAGELTQFLQQNSSSAVLNRVTSGNASSILGKLQSNGQVFLINPNGLVIGQGAVINTAGFVGSTLNITDQDFLNGRLHFQGDNAGSIDNQGFIRAGDGGDILLIAPNIENSGILQVDGGNILLAAGESITISSLDDADISFEVQAEENSVTNLGEIIANDGAANLFAGTLTHTGSVSANSISIDAAGNIRLVAQGTNWIEGDVTATSSTGAGGNIELLGEQVGLDGQAVIDTSGQSGGGQILIGGDYQGQGGVQTARASFVGEDVVIKADALGNGDGGRVIVWSDETTRMYGSISATGGAASGDGGFVETSGGWFDVGLYVPDVSSTNGEGGTWLIDPHNIAIVAGGGSTGIGGTNPFSSNADNATLGVDVIAAALEGGADVLVQTTNTPVSAQAGNITWANGVTLDMDDVPAQTLTLSAHNDINIDGNITYQGGIAQGINLTIIADSDGDGTGAFNLGTTGDLLLTDNGSVGTLDISAGGDIVLDGIINTNGGSITLNTTNGGISQALSASTNANDLVITSAGDIDFQGANVFTNLNILQTSPGSINFVNTSNLSIDVISAAGSTITIDNSGTIDQVGAIGGIVASSLDITGNNDVTLNDSGNDIDSLSASILGANGSNLLVSFTDQDDLEVQDISVSNNNTSPPDDSFLDIVTGGNMTLNGNVTVTGPAAGNSGVTLVAQNGADIIYQNGTITTDNIHFQDDANSTTTGSVGSVLNPVHASATLASSTVNINHGSNGGSGPGLSGGDLFLLNTSGDLSISDYKPQSPSALLIENSAGNIDFSGATLVDAAGTPTDLLSATSIDLKASGTLALPTLVVIRPSVASRLQATTGDISLEAQNLSIDSNIDAFGSITLTSNSLLVQNAVTSSGGNVELRADAFNITGNITAQNQVVVREFSAAGGLEVNDGTPTSGFATLTSSDLGFMNGTNLGTLLGNDLAHTGTKSIQLVSDINSSNIGGTALTFDTTNNASGTSTALVAANIDFTSGNENLLFTGNGSATITPGASGSVLVDTGSGNLTSSVTDLFINGNLNEHSVVQTNNADVSGGLFVIAGAQGGSFAALRGNNLTVTGNGMVESVGVADTGNIDFTNSINISTSGTVNVVGGNLANAGAELRTDGTASIRADSGINVIGGIGNSSNAKISAGVSANLDATGSTILIQAGVGVDSDAFVSAGSGAGAATLNYASCTGCDNQLTADPSGNGVSDIGIFARNISQNGVVTASANNSGNLNPVPELDSLFNNFTAQYVEPVDEDDEDEDELLICR